MASKAYVDQLLNALDANLRYPIRSAIWYCMDNWGLGNAARATNAQWYQFTSTTASVANTEFTVRHGLNTPPKWIIPVLDLQTAGAQLVPLTVTRTPDNTYLYLKSSSTSAVFTVYVEP